MLIVLMVICKFFRHPLKKALNEAETTRRNALLANYASLKAKNNMTKEDEELQSIRTTDKAMMWISDPYNQTKQEQRFIHGQ